MDLPLRSLVLVVGLVHVPDGHKPYANFIYLPAFLR
jgi:hypothetical protein